MQNIIKRITRAAIGTGLLLLIPLALQLTIGTGVDGQGFNWKPGDFIVIGILLFGMGIAIDFVAGKFTNPVKKAVVITALVVAFLIVWAELAVGIFGTPFAGS
ncbi:MAG: hypothetical protein Q8P01_03450 [bacterium]|nr:hypothetical protein [bacterium]